MPIFNPHILLVIRWLLTPNAFSTEELDSNYNAAFEIYHAFNNDVFAVVVEVAGNTADAAVATRVATAEYYMNNTKEHLNEYFKLTKEDRQEYEQQARYLNVLGGSNEKV